MTLLIRNLRLRTCIGISKVEQSTERDVVVNISLEYDAALACAQDSIDHAIDYRKVRDRVADLVQSSRFKLIETMADHIVAALAGDPRISRLQVEVEKPGALRLADSVSALLKWERRRGTD